MDRAVALVLEVGKPVGLALERAVALARPVGGRLVIVGVAGPLPLIQYWAPLTGIGLRELQSDHYAQARELAEACSDQVPADVTCQVRWVSGWHDAWLVARVLGGEFTTVVLPESCLRRKTQRLLRRVVSTGHSDLVVAGLQPAA